MTERYFDGIQVGDKVYSLKGEEFTVKAIDGDFFRAHSGNDFWWITYDGFAHGFDRLINQAFFWQPVHIDPPPRPKRKVKKVVEGWVNIYPDMEISGFIYGTQKEARALRSAHHLGDPLYIRHEYEVEE